MSFVYPDQISPKGNPVLTLTCLLSLLSAMVLVFAGQFPWFLLTLVVALVAIHSLSHLLRGPALKRQGR